MFIDLAAQVVTMTRAYELMEYFRSNIWYMAKVQSTEECGGIKAGSHRVCA